MADNTLPFQWSLDSIANLSLLFSLSLSLSLSLSYFKPWPSELLVTNVTDYSNIRFTYNACSDPNFYINYEKDMHRIW